MPAPARAAATILARTSTPGRIVLEAIRYSVARLNAARQAAASLTPGSHVLVVGTVTHRSYTGEDRIPRVAVTLDVQHIGQALT